MKLEGEGSGAGLYGLELCMDDALGPLNTLKKYRNIYGLVFTQCASTAPL